LTPSRDFVRFITVAYRKHPIFPGQIYHIFNRGVASQPIFGSSTDYRRFCRVTDFYRFIVETRYSYFNRLPVEERNSFISELHGKGKKQVSLFAFCLMSNHFHFLGRELVEGGIRRFISNVQNSYAKYINARRKRTGALFQEMFKTVRVENDEQFLHVARYIHLNPSTSFVVKETSDLLSYPWSSFPDYLGKQRFEFIDKEFLNGFYKDNNKLKDFVFDQVNYQRELKNIGHLLLE